MANHLHTLFHKSPRNFAFSVRGAQSSRTQPARLPRANRRHAHIIRTATPQSLPKPPYWTRSFHGFGARIRRADMPSG